MHGKQFPSDHPHRQALNDEVHARPPEELVAPTRLSFLALAVDAEQRKQNFDLMCELAQSAGVPPPEAGANHYSADLGGFRLKSEQHTEFMRFMFTVPGEESGPFAEPAIREVPQEWLSRLAGDVLVATHVIFLPGGDAPRDYERISEEMFDGNPLVGSAVGGGVGRAYTDFRIRPDGFSRLFLEDHGLTRRQAGRTVQRILEIDTYRMLALLTFPLAKQLAPELGEAEQRLAEITTALVSATRTNEPELLDRLTKLQAEITSRRADNDYRFTAASAYYTLVQSRIRELREQRIPGLQTFEEFVGRRLAPAINTCQTVAERQASLSDKVAQATQLLSTRVDIERQTQNQSLLESMDKRAKMQLMLQQTVEGLSVAAISYYLVSLVGYAAEGIVKGTGVPANPDVIMAISIPIVVFGVWQVVRRARKAIGKSHRIEHM
ncbi:putative membrane-anchored protein [Dichotomicrobium thermohalophilum]|uniref:Putative membrane-anchored protein n=1 Tax=Dichotomicrobium thermohalophilum TaxID=933063 RepID=A0A397QFA7_9HYPH|nr:putative membrane-anchored protein [Dichotomicrobium thermohalophilum]